VRLCFSALVLRPTLFFCLSVLTGCQFITPRRLTSPRAAGPIEFSHPETFASSSAFRAFLLTASSSSSSSPFGLSGGTTRESLFGDLISGQIPLSAQEPGVTAPAATVDSGNPAQAGRGALSVEGWRLESVSPASEPVTSSAGSDAMADALIEALWDSLPPSQEIPAAWGALRSVVRDPLAGESVGFFEDSSGMIRQRVLVRRRIRVIRTDGVGARILWYLKVQRRISM